MRQTLTKSTVLSAALAVAGWLAACDSDAPKPVPFEASRSQAAASAAPAPAAAEARQAQPASPSPAAELPAGHPPLGSTGLAPAAPVREGGEVHWTVPAGWVAETPVSAMRKAQYRVPGPAGDAEFLVFYFGPGQGGDSMSNAQRWASQFRTADGRDGSAAMKTSEITAGGMKVLMVEVAGTYAGGMGSTTAGEKSGYLLLGAIAQGPDSNWFFKLTGPEKTVSAQRGAFEGLIRSLKKGA